MSHVEITVALGRLERLLNKGSFEQLKETLTEYEVETGLSKKELINHPIRNHNGRTLVHLAARNGNFNCLELLLESGGNPNARSYLTDMSQTPLHVAAYKGYPHCIDTLLKHGARSNIKNAQTETPSYLVKGKVACEGIFRKYEPPPRRRKVWEEDNIPSDSPEEQEFRANIERHMQESGCVQRRIGNLVFVGLPGSGKSVLIANLLNPAKVKDLIDVSSSTGIMDGIITVDISEDISNLVAIDVDNKCGWTQVEFGLSCLRQMGVKGFVPSSQKKDLRDPARRQAKSDEDEKAHRGIRIRLPLFKKRRPQRQSRSLSPIPTRQQHKVPNVLSIVDKLLKENKKADILRFLHNKCSLYLSDTGGQIEFQELLPLLVAARAIFIFLFSLVTGLDVKVNVSFRKKVGGSIEHSNSYTSSITVRESFLQTLSSIDSMETFEDDPTFKQHKPYVFVVGTHRDQLEKQLGREGATERIAELNRELLSIVTEHKYKELVVMASPNQEEVMFAVDNTCPGDPIFHHIRCEIKRFIDSRDEFKIKFPLSYLLATLELYESKDAFIDRDKFTRDVARYGIKEQDIDHLIHFLHSRIGLIRYFPIEGLRRIIVREPQVLYNLVSHLIIESFLTSTAVVSEYSEIQKGIYSLEYLHKCISELNVESDLVNLETLILLLRELRIMAPFYDAESKANKYFFPCVLNHLSEDRKFAERSIVQSLAIKFECGHCPKGIFGVLIHYALTHTESDRSMEWVLDKSLIFRDQVSFKVGPYSDVVTLKISSTHLEVSCHPTAQPERDESFSIKVICNVVRSTLLSGIEKARKSLHYDKRKTMHNLGLICINAECSMLHEIKMIGRERKITNCSEQLCSLPDSGLYWFASAPEYHFHQGCQINVIEGRDVEVQFDVISDPPLLNEHTLFKDGVPVSKDGVCIQGSAIQFTSVRKEDGGEYTITSSNGIEEGMGVFDLNVLSPPHYMLDDDYIWAEVGKCPSLHFTVSSSSPLSASSQQHCIRSKDGRIIRKFKTSSSRITFRDLEMCDSGEYTISCRDCNGLEGKATFELKVSSPPNDEDLSSYVIVAPSRDQPPSTPRQVQDPFSIDAKPNLRHLVCLRTDNKQLKVVQKVGVDWMQLGLALDFDYNELKAIDKNTGFITEESCLELLSRWLDGKACRPVTWSTLIQALEDVGHAEIASQLEHFLKH